MPDNPREIVTMAERRFPVQIRIGVPPGGFGQRYADMTEWLDGNCGADRWAITPSDMRGVLKDAVSIYFRDATLASAFVARWCAASRVETEGGLFRIRDDEPPPRIGAGLHRVRVAEEQPGVNRGDSGLAAATSRDHFRAANEEDPIMTMARQKRESGFKTNPDYKVTFEPSPRRVRVKFDGETIADTTNVHLLFETRHLPVYYFPRSDVRFDLMTETDHHTFCPFKGTASYWTIAVGDRVAENAVWGYPDPFDEVAAIKDSVAFYWDRVDAWYEEDEEIFVHPRDPYKRVDVLESFRPVQVVVGGKVVAETRRARFLFETRLPTRYYIPPEDVRMDLLVASDKVTRCPYKGKARYYSIKIDDKLFGDLVWTYPDPIPECPKIKGYLCFFNEHVDDILVDGVSQLRPLTPWSKDWDEKAPTVPDPRGPMVRP